jgi:hypothetical protein
MDIIKFNILNSQLLCWPCTVLGARIEVKGQPWPPSSQEELQDSSSMECSSTHVHVSSIIAACLKLTFVY